MLMAIGRWDEYRKRMTGTHDIEKAWIETSQTRRAIALYSGKTRDIISAMSYLPEFSPDMWLISIAVPSRPSQPDRL